MASTLRSGAIRSLGASKRLPCPAKKNIIVASPWSGMFVFSRRWVLKADRMAERVAFSFSSRTMLEDGTSRFKRYFSTALASLTAPRRVCSSSVLKYYWTCRLCVIQEKGTYIIDANNEHKNGPRVIFGRCVAHFPRSSPGYWA
jgi:hypothetical protein